MRQKQGNHKDDLEEEEEGERRRRRGRRGGVEGEVIGRDGRECFSVGRAFSFLFGYLGLLTHRQIAAIMQ